MGFSTDVKATRATGNATIFAGRTRLRGIIVVSNGSGAGSVLLRDNDDQTVIQFDIPQGDVFTFNLPTDGVVFPNGMKAHSLTNVTSITVFHD
jgi:hypothetical protein